MNASQLVMEESPFQYGADAAANCSSCLGLDEALDTIGKTGDITLEEFIPPISNRRDGGLTMDRT